MLEFLTRDDQGCSYSENVSRYTVRWDLRAFAVSAVAQDHMVLLH